jgi:hypothetical protein
MTPELLADERAVGCLDEVGSRDASRDDSRRIPHVDENAKVPLLPVIENDLRLHSKRLPVTVSTDWCSERPCNAKRSS